jgi:hypothetical protein
MTPEELKQKSAELIEESVTAPPGRIAEINAELTAIKSYFSEKLDNILVFKAERLYSLRQESGKANAAKIQWDASPEGKNEILLRGIIGRIKDSISVNKQRIQVKHDEAFGSY